MFAMIKKRSCGLVVDRLACLFDTETNLVVPVLGLFLFDSDPIPILTSKKVK